MGPRPAIKLLHTADIRFGDGYWEEGLARQALTDVVDIALKLQVHAMLIAGDLFDRNDASPEDVDFIVGELGRLPCPIILLPGNHDALDAQSVYLNHDFYTACPNLKILSDPNGDMLTFPDLHLVVWGRPIVEHSFGFNPLQHLPAPKNDFWQVAVAHGLCPLNGWDPDRSSLVRIEEIATSGWHYLALGHVHTYRDVSEHGITACYCGTPVNTNHLSDSGSVAIVEMNADGVSARRLSLTASS